MVNKKRASDYNGFDIATGEVLPEPKQVKVWNWLNYESTPVIKTEQPDMTIPDQALSLREIVENHSSGILLNGQKTAIFDELEQSEGINILTLDLIDIQELKIMNNQQIKDLQQKAIDEIKARKDKANEARAALQAEAAEKALKAFEERLKTNTP